MLELGTFDTWFDDIEGMRQRRGGTRRPEFGKRTTVRKLTFARYRDRQLVRQRGIAGAASNPVQNRVLHLCKFHGG